QIASSLASLATPLAMSHESGLFMTQNRVNACWCPSPNGCTANVERPYLDRPDLSLQSARDYGDPRQREGEQEQDARARAGGRSLAALAAPPVERPLAAGAPLFAIDRSTTICQTSDDMQVSGERRTLEGQSTTEVILSTFRANGLLLATGDLLAAEHGLTS